jgi:hypothetical protein
MTVLLDQEITGNGQYNFGGNQVQYLLVDLDVLGPDVAVVDTTNPDQIARAGWLSLGSRDVFGSGVEHPFWNERIWINFASFQWHPQPTVWGNNSPDFAVWASDIRWALSPQTHGYLLVIGL